MSDEVLDLLRDVSHALQARMRDLPVFGELGLAPYQGRLLAVIGRRPGCSQQALAESTGRDKAQVARTIKELERRGLISRAAHADDWRTQALTLTEAGEAARAAIEAERAMLGTIALRTLAPAQREALTLGLATMRDALIDEGGSTAIAN